MSYHSFYVANINHCDNLFEKGVGFMNLSHRTDTFTDSVIRRMTRVCLKSDYSHGLARGSSQNDDVKFCEDLARIVGVGAVPGSSFFKEDVNHLIRFHFAKKDETLLAALDKLKDIKKKMPHY